jgi:transmembrane sensor
MSENLEHGNRQLEFLHAQQASAWIQVLIDATPEQRTAFIKWLKESPRHVRDFLFMLTIEQALDHLDSRRLREIDHLVAQIDGRVVSLTGTRGAEASAPAPMPAGGERRATGTGWARRLMAAAAAALLAAGVLWILMADGRSGWKEYATATGEQRAFELEDGSVVHLNTHSRVALRLSQQLREVRLLQGEALFRVHHDTARPFRVYTTDAVIQAVGTQFNVYNRADGTEVAVIEGRVNVTPQLRSQPMKFEVPTAALGENPSTRSVGASETARVERGQLSVRAMPDVADVVAWRDRRLVFRNESLEHIVAEFNRYSARQIRLDGLNIGSRVFSGVFDVDDPDSLAQVLARDATLSVSYSAQGVVVAER